MSTGELPPIESLIPPPQDIIDDNKVYSIAATCIGLGVVTSLFVCMRLGTRMWYRSFGADDWAAVAALFFFIGWTAFAGHINLNAGVGKPLWENTLGEWSLFWEAVLISSFLYPSMSGMIRISTVFFYRRLFAHDRVTSFVLHVLLGFQIAYIIAFTVTPGFVCNPIWKIKEPAEVLMYCDYNFFTANQTAVYVVSIASDLALAIFPIIIVYKLQLPTKKRITAGVIFLFGASATVASIYKFAIHINEGENPTMPPQEWFNYQLSRIIPVQFARYGVTFWIPCQIEPSVALIGMSLPALRQLYFKIRGRDLTGTVVTSGSKPMSGHTGTSTQKKTLVSSQDGGHAGRFYQINDSEIELRAASGASSTGHKGRQSFDP